MYWDGGLEFIGVGGFNTATQASPFGQTAFGKPISTTSFGTAGTAPVFGSNNTSLFSAKPAGATTGGLFGTNTAAPTFGQPATTQPSFGGTIRFQNHCLG